VLKLSFISALGVVIAMGGCAKPPARASCDAARGDSAALAARATDTISRLRSRPQYVTRMTVSSRAVVFRTEDVDPAAFHAGGKVGFDCAGTLRLVWLDGG
jgi:hypothetical protein